MSWSGKPCLVAKVGRLVLTMTVCRIQEECQPGYHPGDDEDWFVASKRTSADLSNLQIIGHVEKTNDRDYEVEERYECPHRPVTF
jgi:hypothetical protein